MSCPSLRIVVSGHTDSSGTAAVNERLAIRRARTVRLIVEGFGVEAQRLPVANWQESKNKCSRERRGAKSICDVRNRTVELTVLTE
jgi:outer membrane protein OmpA-like peptidoglycan-associated protein